MASALLFKIFGIIGLILISSGMLVKKRSTRDLLSIIGGASLLMYSIYLNDVIFIILQAVYILVTMFDYSKQLKK